MKNLICIKYLNFVFNTSNPDIINIFSKKYYCYIFIGLTLFATIAAYPIIIYRNFINYKFEYNKRFIYNYIQTIAFALVYYIIIFVFISLFALDNNWLITTINIVILYALPIILLYVMLIIVNITRAINKNINFKNKEMEKLLTKEKELVQEIDFYEKELTRKINDLSHIRYNMRLLKET